MADDSGGVLGWRLRNALRRLGSGLPPRSGVVFPGVATDLFHAHLAVYRFAGRFASGVRVLDLGCGSGYGGRELRRAGAVEVVGVDPDLASLGLARRRFAGDGVRFHVGSAEDPGEEAASFGLVVAANVLPQVADLDAALGRVRSLLAPGGRLVASLPPLLDGQALSLYQVNPRHRQALYLWDWLAVLGERFTALALYRQRPPAGRVPSLGDPGPARVLAGEYLFEELPASDLYDVGSLAAVVVAAADPP